MNKIILMSCLVLISCLAHSKTVSIATNQWSPFISAEKQALGSAADLLRQIYSQEDISIEWQYQNYDLAFELVANDKQASAYPYFRTNERLPHVLYSDAIFSVTNLLYFNRQKENILNFSQLEKNSYGKVAGYSYGQTIDSYLVDAKIFPNEKQALESLLKNEIDFLPMTQSVMNALLNNTYSDQALLVKQVENVIGRDTLHLIAPKTDIGAQLISKLNDLIKQVKQVKSLSLKPTDRVKAQDIAKLIAAEGYPAIVGQTSLDENANFFTLPQGSKVLILKWSDKILRASKTDRIYKSMIDLSYVVVLNGPHVGKELYIKNMHLVIQ